MWYPDRDEVVINYEAACLSVDCIVNNVGANFNIPIQPSHAITLILKTDCLTSYDKYRLLTNTYHIDYKDTCLLDFIIRKEIESRGKDPLFNPDSHVYWRSNMKNIIWVIVNQLIAMVDANIDPDIIYAMLWKNTNHLDFQLSQINICSSIARYGNNYPLIINNFLILLQKLHRNGISAERIFNLLHLGTSKNEWDKCQSFLALISKKIDLLILRNILKADLEKQLTLKDLKENPATFLENMKKWPIDFNLVPTEFFRQDNYLATIRAAFRLYHKLNDVVELIISGNPSTNSEIPLLFVPFLNVCLEQLNKTPRICLKQLDASSFCEIYVQSLANIVKRSTSVDLDECHINIEFVRILVAINNHIGGKGYINALRSTESDFSLFKELVPCISRKASFYVHFDKSLKYSVNIFNSINHTISITGLHSSEIIDELLKIFPKEQSKSLYLDGAYTEDIRINDFDITKLTIINNTMTPAMFSYNNFAKFLLGMGSLQHLILLGLTFVDQGTSFIDSDPQVAIIDQIFQHPELEVLHIDLPLNSNSLYSLNAALKNNRKLTYLELGNSIKGNNISFKAMSNMLTDSLSDSNFTIESILLIGHRLKNSFLQRNRGLNLVAKFKLAKKCINILLSFISDLHTPGIAISYNKILFLWRILFIAIELVQQLKANQYPSRKDPIHACFCIQLDRIYAELFAYVTATADRFEYVVLALNEGLDRYLLDEGLDRYLLETVSDWGFRHEWSNIIQKDITLELVRDAGYLEYCSATIMYLLDAYCNFMRNVKYGAVMLKYSDRLIKSALFFHQQNQEPTILNKTGAILFMLLQHKILSLCVEYQTCSESQILFNNVKIAKELDELMDAVKRHLTRNKSLADRLTSLVIRNSLINNLEEVMKQIDEIKQMLSKDKIIKIAATSASLDEMLFFVPTAVIAQDKKITPTFEAESTVSQHEKLLLPPQSVASDSQNEKLLLPSHAISSSEASEVKDALKPPSVNLLPAPPPTFVSTDVTARVKNDDVFDAQKVSQPQSTFVPVLLAPMPATEEYTQIADLIQQSLNSGIDISDFPEEFTDKLSKEDELIRDPVIAADGELYDRKSFIRYINLCHVNKTPANSAYTGKVFKNFNLEICALARRQIIKFLQDKIDLAKKLKQKQQAVSANKDAETQRVAAKADANEVSLKPPTAIVESDNASLDQASTSTGLIFKKIATDLSLCEVKNNNPTNLINGSVISTAQQSNANNSMQKHTSNSENNVKDITAEDIEAVGSRSNSPVRLSRETIAHLAENMLLRPPSKDKSAEQNQNNDNNFEQYDDSKQKSIKSESPLFG